MIPMSALRHFQTEDWGAAQILSIFSNHFFFVSNCLNGLSVLVAMGGMEDSPDKHPTKGLGEAYVSSLSLTLGCPSHFPLRCLRLLLGATVGEIKYQK